MPEMKIPPLTIDLTVNLPLVVAIVGGIAAGSAAYASIVERLEDVETRTANIQYIENQLSRLDERSEASKQTLERIERRLEQVQP